MSTIKMKQFLFVAIFAACSISVSAQDILVRKSGEVENVKVLEVSPTEVKYKKSDNEDGPIFIEKRSNLYSVKYKSGEVQTFNDRLEQEGACNYYSCYGIEKKLTHELDLYLGAGWGVGYQLRRDFNPYVGWNVFGISYMSEFCNPRECGLVNFKLLGVRGNTPSYKWFRGYADLCLGYSLEYDYYAGIYYTSTDVYHHFGINLNVGAQVHKNFAFGCHFIYCTPNPFGFIGASFSYLF